MTLTPTQTPLTFPPSTHAKLSPATYLTAHLSSPPSPSQPPLRPSSRSPHTSRIPQIHTRNLTHTHGSAVIRLGDTAVVCGIQGSVLLASNIPSSVAIPPHASTSTSTGSEDDAKKGKKGDRRALADLNLLVPNVELNTGCAPEYLATGPPGLVSQALVQRVVTALCGSGLVGFERLMVYGRGSGAVEDEEEEEEEDEDMDEDMDGGGGGVPLDPTSPPVARQPEMRAVGVGASGRGGVGEGEREGEVKAFYTLNMHIYVLSLDHGANGLFDAVWMALVAALAKTRLPEVWVGDDGGDVNVDWDSPRRKVLREGSWPVASSFGVFKMGRDGLGGANKGEKGGKGGKGGEGEGSVILADPDAFEEGLCEEVVTLLVMEEEGQLRVLGMEKQGGGVVGLDEMKELVALAAERCKTVNKVLEKECRD